MVSLLQQHLNWSAASAAGCPPICGERLSVLGEQRGGANRGAAPQHLHFLTLLLANPSWFSTWRTWTQMWAGHLSSEKKKKGLNTWVSVTILQIRQPARVKRSTCTVVASHGLQGSIASLCVAACRGWKGWSCMRHSCNYWCRWVNVFLSAVQSCVLWEKQNKTKQTKSPQKPLKTWDAEKD